MCTWSFPMKGRAKEAGLQLISVCSLIGLCESHWELGTLVLRAQSCRSPLPPPQPLSSWTRNLWQVLSATTASSPLGKIPVNCLKVLLHCSNPEQMHLSCIFKWFFMSQLVLTAATSEITGASSWCHWPQLRECQGVLSHTHWIYSL